jgi:hypothetical protein
MHGTVVKAVLFVCRFCHGLVKYNYKNRYSIRSDWIGISINYYNVPSTLISELPFPMESALKPAQALQKFDIFYVTSLFSTF